MNLSSKHHQSIFDIDTCTLENMEINTRDDSSVPSNINNTPLYFEEYKLNHFFEIVIELSQLDCSKVETDHLLFIREKLSAVQKAIQFLIGYSESPTPVSLHNLNCMVLNLIAIKFDMINEQCVRNAIGKWKNVIPEVDLKHKMKAALQRSSMNIIMLLNRLILPFINFEMLTSFEEDLLNLKICLFENGCAEMRGFIETFETRISVMKECMKKHQFGKLCPIKLPHLHQSIEQHFDLCVEIWEMPVDIIETIEEMSKSTSVSVIYNDIECLDSVLKNLNLAMSLDFDKEKILGKWVVERALQLIGEYVKSTIDSPKISLPIGQTLERANVPLKKMKLIRNTLSHHKILTLCVRKEFEETSRSEYQQLMHDFKKIRSIFTKALSRREFHLVLEFVVNLEQTYREEIANENLSEHLVAIKESKCLKDIVETLEKLYFEARKYEKMQDVVSCIKEVLSFLKFREVRRDINELFINVESTFSFCNQIIQSNASVTESEAIFKPRMIPLLSSKYSKYMKSMFTSMPTATYLKRFSEKLNDDTAFVPKSRQELYDSFITYARDDILPESYKSAETNNASSVFCSDLAQLLTSCKFYSKEEIINLEAKWKVLCMIHSWKERQDAKNEMFDQNSQIDKTHFEQLIKRLSIDERSSMELQDLFDKDWKKAEQIIRDIPNHFEEFLDQLVKMKSNVILESMDKENLEVLRAMIASFLQTQQRISQVEQLAEDLFRKTLHTLQEEIPATELTRLTEQFNYSLHVHHVISKLLNQISASGFSESENAYDHLLVNLLTQDKSQIERILASRNAKNIQTALNRMTDNYGKFIKSYRKNDQLCSNIKAFRKYAKTLDSSEQHTDLLISEYRRNEFLQYESFFYNRIGELEKMLLAENDVISNAALIEKLYRRFKYNEVMKAAVEMMLLDLLSVLKYLSNSLQNYYQLEEIISISNDALLKNDQVTKVKNMRNALAHGSLKWQHSTQVFATALTFVQNGKLLLALHLVSITEGGANYLINALESNSWPHTLPPNSFLEIGDLSKTIEQSNLWKDEVWRLRLKQILHNETVKATKPLEKCQLWQTFQEELFDAARNNDIPKLRYCIMRDANVNIRNAKLWTPLHYAAISDSIESIRILLEHNADVNGKDIRSWMPLHLAVMRNSVDSVRFLIENLANINSPTRGKLTPLKIAKIINASAIEKLLSDANLYPTAEVTSCKLKAILPQENNTRGNFINMTKHLDVRDEITDCNNEKQQMPASRDEKLSVITEDAARDLTLLRETLISDSDTNPFVSEMYSSPNVDKQMLFARQNTSTTLNPCPMMAFQEVTSSNDMSLPAEQSFDSQSSANDLERFMQAISAGALPIVKVMLESVTNINARGINGKTPILKAASVGNVNIVKLLLENGADVNSEDEDGTTPLIAASTMGYISCVKQLLINKADIERKDNYGHNALHFAIHGKFDDIVKILVENNASVNVPNRSYCAPIHDAVFTRNSSIVQFLLNNGAIVNAEDPHGETPLLAAFGNNDLPTLKILLGSGGDVNAVGNYGNSILHCAVSSELVEIVDLVLKNGADVNRPTLDGRTPLMEAALCGRRDLVEMLLKANAEIDIKDSKGNTAKSEAERNDYRDIVNALEKMRETKKNSSVKNCSEPEEKSAYNHCNADSDTEYVEATHIEGDIRNQIIEEPVETYTFRLARLAVREVVWFAIWEFCNQLISVLM